MIYDRALCATFRKTREANGGLSNMAAGFALRFLDLDVETNEALYQACRFPDHPDLQRQILSERNPMKAKMATKPHRHLTRPDWEVGGARVLAMDWALRVKLAQHPSRFGALLLSTGTKPIVEDSHKDRFWGAVPTDETHLEGDNMLGQLLVKLREEIRDRPMKMFVAPPPLANFRFLGELLTQEV